MSELKIYYVRHGQTEFNVIGHVQGWNNSPLSPLGKFQAQCAGLGLQGIHFDKAYTGPAGRQYDTGMAVLKYSGNEQIQPEKNDLFKEMGYGKMQGGLVSFMMEVASQQLGIKVEKYHSESNECTPYDISKALGQAEYEAETIEESSERLLQGVKHIVEDNPDGGTVLVATSACAVDITVRGLFPQTRFYRLPENCSVTVIRYNNGEFSLEKYGDVSYRIKGEEMLK